MTRVIPNPAIKQFIKQELHKPAASLKADNEDVTMIIRMVKKTGVSGKDEEVLTLVSP